jgi:Na+/H+ antiporter NhaD/arsenite permease-like protein
MLACLIAGFVAMTRFGTSQALVMPSLAMAFLTLDPEASAGILQASFSEFGPVALLFTAVAVPAHQLQEGRLFELFGAWLGRGTGWLSLRYPSVRLAVIIFAIQFLTAIAAALFHNITAIFVMVPIAIAICNRFKFPSHWILCGELIASNLGGFSSRWGDTPNIIEANVWNLSNQIFIQILPANVFILCALSVCVLVLTSRAASEPTAKQSAPDLALASAQFGRQSIELDLDWRRIGIGLAALGGLIALQFAWREWEIAWAAAAICFAVAAERKSDRLHSLQALGIDIYMTLISLFVIAHCFGASLLGNALHAMIQQSGGAPWAIVVSSYFGTMFTEAASWASTAAKTTHAINPSHAAAWALGGGICAGSSSLLTAASAGLILWNESCRRKGHGVTFGSYILFGLGFSSFMVIVYTAYTSLIPFRD